MREPVEELLGWPQTGIRQRLRNPGFLVGALSMDAKALGDDLVDRLSRVDAAGRILEDELRLASILTETGP